MLKGKDRARAFASAKETAVRLGYAGDANGMATAIRQAEAAIGGKLTKGEKLTLQEYFDGALARAKPAKSIAPASRRPLANIDANAVNAAAKRLADAGRGFEGGGNVFICDVADALDVPKSDMEAFKDMIRSMARARLVHLGRADLVEAMDPRKVDASEMSALGGPTSSGPVWHFVSTYARSR